MTLCCSTFDKTSDQLRSHAHVLATLFPGINLGSLAEKNHSELLNMLSLHASSPRLHSNNGSSTVIGAASVSGENGTFEPDGADDSAPISESGEPPAERQWDESLDQAHTVASDDVNAIGLATDHHARSYLGSTSMSTVLTTIFRLCPAAKQHAAQCSNIWATAPAPAQPALPSFGRDPAVGLLKEQRCIDLYFEHVHGISPLLDEEDFRAQYAAGTCQDPSWMGLLNMVLAMGAISLGSDSLHEQYYRQARSFMSLDSLGSGNLNTLQALCLLGGNYLHYRNSPNMAYGVLGAAHRVAIALGMHREPRRQVAIKDPEEAEKYRRRLETRRRTWWSLFCLDTWANMTQGRPTCGRWDSSTMDTLLPQRLHPEDFGAVSLEASVRFCLICDHMQHRFAQAGRLSTNEIRAFDAELRAWYENLPEIMTNPSTTPPRFNVAREFMRNRYCLARTVLSRSSILYMAHDHIRKAEELASENQDTVENCSAIACEAIDFISLNWTLNRIHVWNSAWCLFQACTIPLLFLALERSARRPSPPDSVMLWRGSLAKALESFAEMRPWMRASDRSPDIVAALYDALISESDGGGGGAGSNATPPLTDTSNLDLFGWYDEQLTGLDWNVFLGGDSTGQGVFLNM